MSTELDTGQDPAQEAAEQALARAHGEDPDGGLDEAEQFPEATRVAHAERLARQERPDVEVVDDVYADARQRAAAGTADEDDWDAVTDWLLSDTAEVITRKLNIRVGGGDNDPRRVPWIVRAVDVNVIRSAEREAAGNRAARRTGQPEYDELKANLRILVEGTVKPDLKAIARQRGISDPVVLVQQRLQFRPGIVAQIAGEIMSLSGFDQDDVSAAGNS